MQQGRAAMRGLAFYANYSPQTRVARPTLFCRFAHSVTGLPCIFRKVGSPEAIRSLQKQEIRLSCNFFFDWGLSPVPAKRKQSIIWAIYCVFEPISAFCRSATIPNRKKVATQADFLFSTFQNVIELTP